MSPVQAPVQAPVAPPPSHPARPWTTPRTLAALRNLILVLLLVLVAVTLAAVGLHRSGLQAVGVDAAPSIEAAQQIKAELAAMDNAAANELLEPPDGSIASSREFDNHRLAVSKALLLAARNITYGDAELRPIETIQNDLGDYERLIQKARDLRGTSMASAISTYGQATIDMDRSLLPAADALDQANDTELQATYSSLGSRARAVRALVLLLALLTAGVLGYAQVFLSRRTRRTFNPALVLATALTVALGLWAFVAMQAGQNHLKIAKEDAFSSIEALLRARADTFEANTDESRMLLDPSHAATAMASFDRLTGRVATAPPGMSSASLLRVAAQRPVPGFTGLLADELGNITFPGEREAAVGTLDLFEQYLAIDRTLRGLAAAGRTQQALALDLGTRPGQSDWAFDEFNTRLNSTLAINRDAFGHAVADGFHDLSHLELDLSALALFAAVLTFAGFRPRLREYN